MRYLFAGLILGMVSGYLLAVLTMPPKVETVYQETHYFKDPVTLQEGDTVYFVFQTKDEVLDLRWYDVDEPPTSGMVGTTITGNREYFRRYEAP
jgi:hypothetical protein